MSISDQFVVRNLDTGEVFRPSSFGIGSLDGPMKLTSASPDDVVDFKRQFNTFSYDEKLLYAVKCMLWESLASFQARKIKKRHSGTIFISNRHLSFAEDASAGIKPVKIGIPLSEIVDLTAEDYGLSEGIVVSTMKDTKFFFEQFPNRSDCFDALYRTWSLTQNSSPDQLASIFDPLGGLSAAVTSSAMRNVASPSTEPQAKMSDSVPVSMLQKRQPPPPPSPSKPPIPSSNMPVVKPMPPPPALVSSPISTTKSHVQQSHPSKQMYHAKSSQPVEHHFMDLTKSDSWFMTLTKIYYWLGAQPRQPPVRSQTTRTST